MTTIQILGSGCLRCDRLLRAAEDAVREIGLDASVEKVSEIARILEFSPRALAALVIDGETKSAGQSLTADEIKALLSKR